MTRILSIFIFLFIFSEHICAQNENTFQFDINFSSHLIQIKAYHEASIYLNEIQSNYKNPIQKDSINFLLGKTYYLDKKLNSSIHAYNLVSNQIVNMHLNAKFHAAFEYSYLKQYDYAINSLTDLQPKEDLYKQLKFTQLAGNYLLTNNLTAFDTISQNFTEKHLDLQRTNSRLLNYAQDISEFKNKSPLVAGLLSAIVPGSGKIYAGKTGEGVSLFLQHLIFGFMLRESFIKYGPRSIQFGVFGTIFSTLYIANIWSSTFSVKIYRNEYYDSIHESIMLDLHIPLRTVFK